MTLIGTPFTGFFAMDFKSIWRVLFSVEENQEIS
jgi:hypothetical protein